MSTVTRGTRSKPRGCFLACAAGLCCATGAAHGFVVNNPSFETGVAVPGGPLSTAWNFDNHSFVTAQNGVTPAAGNRMLKFLNTGFAGPTGVVCDVFQIIDLTAPADQAMITGGSATLSASTLFNRVRDKPPSPVVVDTQFRITLYSATSFANAQALTTTGSNTVNLFSDPNLLTWEPINCAMPLPASTQWAVLHLAAIENVVDDNVALEFHGHYADDVRMTLTPSPGTLALVGLGGVLAAKRRR